MENFWDFSAWGTLNVIAVLFVSLLAANALKKAFHFLQASLIPTSVLGGGMLIIVAAMYRLITGEVMFDTSFFGKNGTATLEIITYHTLALGFIASTLKGGKGKLTKQRTTEIFNTGVTTVATYLLQGIFGMTISMLAVCFVPDFFAAAGILLPFGYGQGTGQALNYGNIFEMEHGFAGGKSFGLTIAALGFLSASIGGVIYLNYLKRSGRVTEQMIAERKLRSEEIQGDNEIPMQESIDKMTVQVALVVVSYLLAYLLMYILGNLLPGMKAVIFGFNFLLGVLMATVVKLILNRWKRKEVVKKEYVNDFLMTRTSNFFFDIMVVAGIAAIRLDTLEDFWGIVLIMGFVGLIVTYIYNHFVAKKLFFEYREEQFLTIFGMLTGTASTGIILLREIDGDFETPASDNMVYQNFPAIVFGFPLMIIATMAPVKPMFTLIVLILFFMVMNVILFRSYLFASFRKKKEK